MEVHFKMDEKAQGAIEILLISVIVIVLATSTTLFIKSSANAATDAAIDAADTNN